ncbi:MAG: MprA protease, GlyGly-CTERM protein-sorting domain-containing form [Luteolibacter sp.]
MKAVFPLPCYSTIPLQRSFLGESGFIRKIAGKAIIPVISFSALVSSAQGAFIQPNSATASSSYSSYYVAANTINGTGMPAEFDETDVHAIYVRGNHWTTASAGGPVGQWIQWGFTTPQKLDAMYVWNHLSTTSAGGGVANNSQYEVTLYDLALYDSSSNLIVSWTGLTLLPDTNAAQTFSFGQAYEDVSYVRFTIQQTQGSTNYTGLAEVGFNAVLNAVPEPSSALLLGMAGMLAFVRRRSA